MRPMTATTHAKAPANAAKDRTGTGTAAHAPAAFAGRLRGRAAVGGRAGESLSIATLGAWRGMADGHPWKTNGSP